MKWAKKYISIYNQPLDNVQEGIIQEIKQKLAKVQSDEPVVTVSVIAYNEERHLLPCLWALSEMRCEYPVEIIGVNNDSSDRTGEIFRLVGLPHYLEKRHSCGYARQCGLDHARGRYQEPSPIRPDPSRSFADSGKRSLLLLMELYPG